MFCVHQHRLSSVVFSAIILYPVLVDIVPGALSMQLLWCQWGSILYCRNAMCWVLKIYINDCWIYILQIGQNIIVISF